MTIKEAKKRIKDSGYSWKVFIEWMVGQTGYIENGKLCYFDHDVDRFIERLKGDPKNENSFEFD